MKSFFKKLAFVMAMAMVVSLAAPAAANAAEKEVYLCYQDDATKTRVDMHAMKIGEKADFRFIDAPDNWKTLGWKWETTNPEIATVDPVSGDDLTGIAAGTTTLNFILGGEVVATTEIVVTAPSTKDQFEATQTSYKELTLKFAEDTEIKSETVKLFLMLPNEEDPANPISVPWPVAAHKNVDKKTITVQPTVELGNGDVIKVVAGAHEEIVTTIIAKPDTLVLSVKDGKTTVNKEQAFQVIPTLYANGGKIDVTGLYLDAYEIKYTPEIISFNDKTFTKDDYSVSEDGNYVVTADIFEIGMGLAFKATLVDKDNKVVATSNTVSVECVEATPWTFDGKVKDWAIVKNGAEFVNWSKKSIPADASAAGEYSIVLKFEDNAGKTYVTNKAAVQENKNEGDAENIYMDGNDPISKAKYEVLFYSTNPDVMLVDEATGALGIYTPDKVTFYVGLNYYGGDEDVMKYIYARELEITPATRLDEIKVKDGKSVDILTAAVDADFLSSEKVTILAEDQYDQAWTKVAYTAYYTNNKNEKVPVGTIKGSEITFTSADFAGLKDTTLTVTVEGVTTDVLGNNEKATTTVRVNIKTPNYESDGKTIKLDQTVTNRYITYDKVVIEDSEIDVNAISKTGYITLYKTSNGAKVDTYTKADGFVAVTKKADLDNLKAEGAKYVVMKDAAGNIIPLSWTPSGDKLQYTFNTLTKVEGVTGSKLAFAANGGYTVEAVIVRYNQRNGNQSDVTEGAVVTVKNSFKEVKLDGWKTKTYVGKNCIDAEGNVDVEKVILETVKFKDATITADEIIDFKAVELGENVIIQYVTVRVYLDEAKTAYYEKTLKPELIALKSDGTRVSAQ